MNPDQPWMKCPNQKGQVLIEALVTWTLLLAIILGTWKLFQRELNRLETLELEFHHFRH